MYRMYITVIALLSATPMFATDPAQPGQRTPQWPLKTDRVLLTEQQIQRARTLCETDESAAAVRERLLESVEYWADRSDRELHDLLPDGRVARAFNVSTEGCPVHGKAIYKHGFYPWKLDRARPFTIICPIGGETYPSNDFEAYYRSDFTDASLLTGDHADPGRGWVAPSGEKYWLVGYACHWNWQNTWLPALTDLAQAYVLTGDRIYARKAIVMLDRIAEIYPGMDYSRQSRYAELTGGHYHGKILNSIWETRVLSRLATAYDYVYDALVGEEAVALDWRSSEEIRVNIEANLLEEGIDAVARHRIRGNFGMHQNALARAVAVRQHGPTGQLLDSIMNHTGGSQTDEGLNYALYNLIFKDGMPYESSPGYCFGWVGNFVRLSEPLRLAGIELLAIPKMKHVFDAPLEMICAGKFTPAIGDAGTITSEWIGPNAPAYMAAYAHFEEPRYAWALSELGALGESEITSFDDLVKMPPVARARADAARYRHRPTSRLLDGYGLAILNNRSDSIAASVYYGIRGGHGHYDRLNIELFAHGHRMAPDLGYPDFMNAFVSGIFSWSKNTISHNTLTVDRTSQRGNDPGRVFRLHDSPTVHVVDIDAPGTYGQVSVYRRTLVLVDVAPDASYLVDVFRVRGGKHHVLSLHGPEGEFAFEGAALSAPNTEGTLAGPDVEYGELYDNPTMNKPDYKGRFAGYRGTGYQHFFNWQRAVPEGITTATWQLAGQSDKRLRLHLMPADGQEIVVADAYVSPTQKIPTVLKYILLRRDATEPGNTFVTVWEPLDGPAIIDRVEGAVARGAADESAVELTVHRGETTDRISMAGASGGDSKPDPWISLVSQRNHQPVRIFAAGGSALTNDERSIQLNVPETVRGVIEKVDYRAHRIRVHVEDTNLDPGDFDDLWVRIHNDRHSAMYRIASAGYHDDTLQLELADSDIFTGRVLIDSIDTAGRTVTTKTAVLYPHALPGMHLVADDLSATAPMTRVDGQTFHLADAAALPAFSAGTNAWISDVGAGDHVEIERYIHKEGDSIAR